MTQSARAESALAAVDRRLAAEFERVRSRPGEPAGSLRGLYVDEQEVESLLRAASERAWARIDEHRLAALQRGLELSDFEVDVLLACLAPELEPAYERVYAFLQDDMGRRRPTVGLLLQLFASAPAQRGYLHPAAPLCRAGLLDVPDTSGGGLLSVAPALDERIVLHLLGGDDLDGRLTGDVRHEARPQRDMLADTTLRQVVAAAARGSDLVALTGPRAVGTTDAARAFACERGLGLLIADVASLLRSPAVAAAEAVRLVFREANLLGAAVLLSRGDLLWEDASLRALNALRDELALWPVSCLLEGEPEWEPPATFGRRTLTRLRLPAPDTAERHAAWRSALMEHGADDEATLAEAALLASRFRLTLPQIRDAVLVARAQAGDGSLEPAQLAAGARALSGRRLAALAQELRPKADWSHLVLPEDTVAQLQELCETVRHHRRVLELSGFAERLSGGTGVTALFSGASGTGKTMGAEVVARELGLPLYRIDLAGVVSKWIGETEKNLDRIFAAATDSNAILFFDEADALFGRRSEVKDSHDRYANLEISFLLQKMESYDGVAILATNMRQQMDDAFVRRLTFNVMFPMPEAAERERIWAAVWPPELPRGEDVDFARLARIRLVGGNVKNVVLAAAHRAAADDRPVALADVLHALRREYQKLGKQTSLAALAAQLDELTRG